MSEKFINLDLPLSINLKALKFNTQNPCLTINNMFNMDITTQIQNETYQEDELTFTSPEDIYKEHLPIIFFIFKHTKVVLYFFGFPGNILSCIMWLRRPLLHSSGCYLAALSISDLIFLVLSFVYDLQITWDVRTLNVPVVCQVFPVIYLTVQYMSPLLTMAFTVERFISIRFPLKRRVFCTVKRAILIIVLLTNLSIMISSIQAYFWVYDDKIHLCLARDDDKLWTNWNWATESTMFMFVPFVILIINIALILQMKKSKRVARRLYGAPKRQRSTTTKMLLVVSFYLICTTLPVSIIYALNVRYPPGVIGDFINDPVWQAHFRYTTGQRGCI
ncbi:hypothetical protein KUTeg_017973 [Tegillarca granosa]|uniref:G-protein coupled receptors family 1 profile domain-containing protein n=1 Tax=Tegillarca granosa TaxID=220873 RepID=A0ABQ9ELG0_TEGGR|nr:hypothetical protein KUTeg_017973 [Tegillarca granosa]